MKVLVFGGCGFLGNNIVRELRNRKINIGVYDRISGSDEDVQYYVGDVISENNLVDIIRPYDVVVYLISAIMPKESMDNPLSSYTTDIPLLIKTLDSCRLAGKKRIVYASSGGTVYGNSSEDNKEDCVEYPINHYGICKLTCEKILLQYNELYGMENVILRISNPFGKSQKIGSGVGIINTLATKARNGETVQIWGDGNNVRDFISVEDVSVAFCLACYWKFDLAVVPVFNIGSGFGISVNEIIGIVSEVLGRDVEVTYCPARSFDVRRNVLDVSKARKILKFNTQNETNTMIKDFVKQIIG